MYCIAGKFGEFGESSMIRQTKAIQISTIDSERFAGLNIHGFNAIKVFTEIFVALAISSA